MTCQASCSLTSLNPSLSTSLVRTSPSLSPPLQKSYDAKICGWTRGSIHSSSHSISYAQTSSQWPVARANIFAFPLPCRTHRCAFRPAGKLLFGHLAARTTTSCSAPNRDSEPASPGQVADREQLPSAARKPPGSPPADISNPEDVVRVTEFQIEMSSPAWQRRWEVPWGGRETAGGMVLWVLTFVGSAVLVPLVAYRIGYDPRENDLDSQSVFLLANQVFRTLVSFLIVYNVTKRFRPLPDNFFKFDLRNPFNLESGWLLWAGIGFVSAAVAVQIVASSASALSRGEPMRGDGDALQQLLPIIAHSPLSTFSLVGVAGVCAPLLEETIFRGFLMTSLTKWLPVPWAALVSGFFFATAHLTPGEIPTLTTLGLILGLSYAKTRNLLTPMLIHSIWNSGIIIVLTILRMEGYEIENLL